MKRVAFIGRPDKGILETLKSRGFHIYSPYDRIYELASADGNFDLERFQAMDTFIRSFDDLAPLNFLLERIDLSSNVAIVDITTKNEVLKLKTYGFTVINLHPDLLHYPADFVGFVDESLEFIDEILPEEWIKKFEEKSKVKLVLKGFFLVRLPYGFFTYSVSNDRFYAEAIYVEPNRLREVKDYIINLAKSLGYKEIYWITHRNGDAFAKISGGEVVAQILKYEVK